MDPFDRERLSDGECVAVFGRLFPLGFAGDDVVAEIAPQGWEGYDWTYTFPRLYVFTFDNADDALPLAERLERERQGAELHRSLEEGHREALEAAKDRPPPETVEAYRRVYGRPPNGWPPWD